MRVERPDLAPDPSLDREAMAELQREVARTATFGDAEVPDPGDVAVSEPVPEEPDDGAGDGPVVVGIDQAFREAAGEAVSAAVAIRGGRVCERTVGRAPLDLPYVPGLLSFREAPAVVAALEALTVAPDLVVLDGSGRIHYRQAGLATHVGVLFDCPAVGVAKSLLCGAPRSSVEDPLPAGSRIAVEADDAVEAVSTAGEWPVVGHAVQTRQYGDTARRHVNPVFASPGHRVGAVTTADLVAALCAGYKLPEPIRLADRRAGHLGGGRDRQG